jgi:hypothetical protein
MYVFWYSPGFPQAALSDILPTEISETEGRFIILILSSHS